MSSRTANPRAVVIFTTALLVLVLAGGSAEAKVSVVATTADLGALAEAVGGPDVAVDSLARGTQDNHAIEAKPSFMVKLSRADLLLANGLSLEIGWLPSVVRGARNPKINPGAEGYLELGPQLDPIDVRPDGVTRAEGDVHPEGNPHFMLDPIRAGRAAELVAERLARIDSKRADSYRRRASALKSELEAKAKDWRTRIQKTGISGVVTYHKTFAYFLKHFGLDNPAVLEPKPGIPPTAGHILQVIQVIRQKKVPLIWVENYFDPAPTRKIRESIPSVRVDAVPVSVGGEPGVNTLSDLYERLVRSLEGR